MADKLSKMILPIKSGNVIAPKEFDLPSGGSGTVDDALSDTSENPVQNKIVKAAVDGKSDTGHNHDDRYYTEAEENQIIEALQSTIVDSIYPVGSLYMSINNTMPSFLTKGKTWELLSGNYVLKTISSGTGGQTSNAENTGSTTLTAAQSGVPAHSHGLNSHTHSIPALSGTAASKSLTGSMYLTHAIKFFEGGSGIISKSGTGAGQTVTWLDSGGTQGNTMNINATHSHSVTTTASTTGAASGSTANNGAANASQGHTHTAGMPQNIGVYVWKRTA